MAAQVVYQSRVFTVEVDQITLRNGRQTGISIVRHRPSVVLIPVREDGRIVLIRQYRHALGQEVWELPAGNVDDGEAPEQAAARECEEEIGLAPTRVERLGSFYPTPGYCDEQMIFFRVSGLQAPAPDSPHRPDEAEHLAARPMTAGDARAVVARGEIVGRKPACAVTLA